MKQKLLLVSASMMLAASSAFAATWENPVENPVKPVFDGESTYLLYNPEAKGFIVAGNNWGTHGCLAKEDSIPEGYYFKLPHVEDQPENVVKMVDSCLVKSNSWQDMFYDGDLTNIYVDHGSQGPETKLYWVIIEADGGYNIQNVYCNETDVEDTYYLGVPASMPTTPAKSDGGNTSTGAVSLNMLPKTADNFVTWQFIDGTKFKTYAAAKKLETAIKNAKDKYADLDLVAEQAVYENTESTVKELLGAAASVDTKFKTRETEEAEATASATNPKDLSGKIVNATFDVVGDFTGWGGSGFGAGGVTGPCAERYQMDFDTYQDVEGLPEGVYLAYVDGFYRAGSIAQAYTANQNNEQNNATFYAVSNEQEFTTPIMHLFHGISPETEAYSGNTTYTVGENVLNIPNTMADFVAYNEAGYYKTNKTMVYVKGGKLRIGVKKSVTLGADWVIVDNFGLTYYGNKADAFQLWMDQIYALAEEAANATYVTKSVLATYKEAIAKCKTAEDYTTVASNIAAIDTAKVVLLANIAAWNAYKAMITRSETEVINNSKISGPDAEDVADIVGDAKKDLTKLTLTTEQIIAATKELDEARAAAIQNGIAPNTDFTNYLTNPAFDSGKGNGWEGAPTVNNNCGEKYGLNADFDVYQVVKDAPVGCYKISMQGFYRQYRDDNAEKQAWYNVFTADGDYKDPRPDTLSYVYMNDNKTAMNCVYDFQVAVENNIYGEGGYSTGALGLFYYPNNMQTAAAAFAQGAYEVSAFGLVAKKGDVLRIGVKGHLGGSDWAIFDNFRLTYMGYDYATIKPEFDKALASLNGVTFVGKEYIDRIDSIKTVAAKYETSEDGKALFNALASIFALNTEMESSIALFKQLSKANETLAEAVKATVSASEGAKKEANDLYDTIKKALSEHAYTDSLANDAIQKIKDMQANLDLYTTLIDANDKFGFAIEASEAAQATKNVADSLYQAVSKALNEKTYGFADVKKALEQIEYYTTQLKIPAGSDDATDASPVDLTSMLGAASFDEDGANSVNGWKGATGYNFGNDANQKAALCLEFYEKDFDLYQEFAGLPNGTYEITCNAFCRSAAPQAEFYATLTAGEVVKKVTSRDTEGSDVALGVGGETTVGSLNVPNDMVSSNAYFSEGYYYMSITVKVEDGKLRFGIRQTTHAQYDWVIMDNFTLTYYGAESKKETDTVVGIEQLTSVAKATKVEIFGLNGAKVEACQSGVNIIRTVMSDGSVKVRKAIRK